MEWMLLPFRRYADFAGRSRRLEFWMFQLLNLIVVTILVALLMSGIPLAELEGMAAEQATGLPAFAATFWLGFVLTMVWWLFTLVPNLALVVRRLHDRDMSSWWYLGFFVAMLIPFVSFVVAIAFLVLMLLDGTPGPNRYGPDPKGRTDAEVFA